MVVAKVSQSAQKEYKGDSIQILEGLQAVRKRPSMYIGDTGSRGYHHLLWEILDNSVDETLAGFCDKIDVHLHSDGSVSVRDNGRGMPVDEHPIKKIPACEVIFTVLHAGGKFDSGAYGVSGGLHGVGAAVVNALSEETVVDIFRHGKQWSMSFKKGIMTTGLTSKSLSSEIKNTTGSLVRFSPDREIFKEINKFDPKIIERKLKEISWLVPGLELTLADETDPEDIKRYSFKNEKGLEDMIIQLSKNSKALFDEVISFTGAMGTTETSFALRYIDDYTERLYSFANLIPTAEGGTHVSGFRSALTRAVNESARHEKILKEKDDNLQGEDLREGLLCVLSVKLLNPQFEGQTKGRLGNSESSSAVASVVYENLSNFFVNEGKNILKLIVEKAQKSRMAREAAKKAKDLVRSKTSQGMKLELPGKLADCISNDMNEAEIFIVEGDSAGGSAKQGRDRKFQAILPLRGKILNVEKSSLDKILANNEVGNIVKALGCGVGREFDLSKLRYGKIVIMTDADVDGAHIRTLLLTLFYRLLPELVVEGRIYAAQPPLYQVKKGKDIRYVYSDSELQEILETGAFKKDAVISRYKGLGEMSPEQLWETTMNPEKRTLRQISVADCDAESGEVLDILMGDRVEPRRDFIMSHALEVSYIDV